jgi:hypothetical protein
MNTYMDTYLCRNDEGLFRGVGAFLNGIGIPFDTGTYIVDMVTYILYINNFYSFVLSFYTFLFFYCIIGIFFINFM